jgi:hypothetical protein
MFPTPYNMRLQHRNSTSAISKINVCNIEKFISNFETFIWNARNMSRKQMKHVCNDLQTKTRHDYNLKMNHCNMSRTLLQHHYTAIATLKKSQNRRRELSPRAACPRRQELPSRPRRRRPGLSSSARARGGEGAPLRPCTPAAAAKVDLPRARSLVLAPAMASSARVDLPRARVPAMTATTRVVGWGIKGVADPRCSWQSFFGLSTLSNSTASAP